jgi:hypothetical protein
MPVGVKLKVHTPALLARSHEGAASGAVLKCKDGVAVAADAVNINISVPKSNLFIIISPHNKEFSSLKQHYINLLLQRALRA